MDATLRSRLGFGALLLAFCAMAGAQNAITTGSADLYAGPDDSYPVVAQVDSNTPLQVMGCLDDWSWCDVDTYGARGWLFAPLISYRYEDGYVPLYSYAPSLGIAIEPFALDDYWDRYYHDRPWYPRREEWSHRTVHHRRPSGPPPSASSPPRPDRDDRPREAARPDQRPLHLGSAQPPRREEAPARPEDVRPEPRPEPRPGPRPESHSSPAPTSPPQDSLRRPDRAGGTDRAGTPAREDHPPSEGHPSHEEQPRSGAPSRPPGEQERPR